MDNEGPLNPVAPADKPVRPKARSRTNDAGSDVRTDAALPLGRLALPCHDARHCGAGGSAQVGPLAFARPLGNLRLLEPPIDPPSEPAETDQGSQTKRLSASRYRDHLVRSLSRDLFFDHRKTPDAPY
jgi:hypothetical protein